MEMDLIQVCSEFFVSNDHYFYSGLGRSLEERYGPFSWASSIVHCKEVSGQFSCTQVSPKNSHAYANGIILLDSGKSLAVADVVYGSISFYDVEPTTKALQLKRTTVCCLEWSLPTVLTNLPRHSGRVRITSQKSLILEISLLQVSSTIYRRVLITANVENSGSERRGTVRTLLGKSYFRPYPPCRGRGPSFSQGSRICARGAVLGRWIFGEYHDCWRC